MKQELKNNLNNTQSITRYSVIRNKCGSYDIIDREGNFVCVCDSEKLAISTADFFTKIDRAAVSPMGVR